MQGNSMQSLSDILDIGSRLVDNGKFEDAFGYFAKAIELNPKDPQAYDHQGIVFFRLLKVDQAIAEFNKALACDASFHFAHFHLAEVYAHLSEYSNAALQCEKALVIEPQNWLYKITLAFIHLQANNNEACIAICNELLYRNPVEIDALEYRSSAYMNIKNYKQAIPDLEVLYNNKAENAAILNNLGYAYSQIGEAKLAQKYLLAAIRISPEFSYPYNNLGYAYLIDGDFKKAHEYIDKSIELDPTNAYAFKNRALVYLAQKANEQAVAALEKAKELRFDIYYGDEVELLLKKHKG
jgi:tetratricopeptide (TPR) repeat protein